MKFEHKTNVKNKIISYLKTTALCIGSLSLSACLIDEPPSWDGSANDGYFSVQSTPSADDSEGYNSSYDSYLSIPDAETSPGVVVPKSYHLDNISNTPVAAKDEDKNWVNNQNQNGYTIQISQDAKPAPVAKKLQQMPKNERSVEVRTRSGSYLGLHGTYPSKEAAEQQLNSLPAADKEGATIKSWQAIQSEVDN